MPKLSADMLLHRDVGNVVTQSGDSDKQAIESRSDELTETGRSILDWFAGAPRRAPADCNGTIL